MSNPLDNGVLQVARNKPRPAKERADAKKRYLAGERITDIAREMRIARSTLNDWAAKEGWRLSGDKVATMSGQKLEDAVSTRLAEMDARHLALLASLRQSALGVLLGRDAAGRPDPQQPLPLKGDVVRAVDRIITLERLIRGEPTDRLDVTAKVLVALAELPPEVVLEMAHQRAREILAAERADGGEGA
jgi:hypothetical protein